MRKHQKLYSIVLVSGSLILFLTLVSSMASASPYVYIPNYDSNIISVIDTEIKKVTATMNVGNNPNGVAVTSNGKMIYVTNSYSNTVSVINTTANKVTAMANVGIGPWGVTVNPAETKVYIAFFGNTFSVINTGTNNVTVAVNVDNQAGEVAVIFDIKKVYVAKISSINVSVIEIATNKITAIMNIGPYTTRVLVTPRCNKCICDELNKREYLRN